MTDFSDIKSRRVAELLKQYQQRILTQQSNRKKSHKYWMMKNNADSSEDHPNFIDLENQCSQSKNGRYQYLQLSAENKWLKQKGKGYLIDFDLRERKQLKKFFHSLDKKNNGYIGLDQLEEMLLSLGLASTIEEVKEMMETVDKDLSGRIQFQEFLQMIQDDSIQNNGLVHFFKELIVARKQPPKHTNKKQNIRLRKKLNFKQIGIDDSDANTDVDLIKKQLAICPKKTPFEMIVNQVRRSHILSSLNIGRFRNNEIKQSDPRIKKGKEVVNSLQKMEERRLIRGFQTSSNFFQSYRS